MEEYIVLVNENDEVLGAAPKLATHNKNTPLHRGFSLFLFRDDGRLLLQQRSHKKKTWPLVWSNSVCGHLTLGETPVRAAKRRLAFELGIHNSQISVVISNYRYRAGKDGIVENEICPVMIGFSNDTPNPNSEEVEDCTWIEWEEWVQEIKAFPNNYSPWCVEEALLLEKNKKFKDFM